ncbi:MAG: hypothetical protein MUF01_00015 [Bryobacterales bacterium]|jgi:hypothetical protein|nr:hypothetical protein [Bryobacterales bacterium]
MKRAFWVTTLALLAAFGACLAQDAASQFRKAPPEVEAGLKATVQDFLTLQMEKKWGESIPYIASESLDTYIASDKFNCFAMEIFTISYNDSYDQATVGVLCERAMATPVGGGRVKMPFSTTWKQVEGKWKWYTPKRKAEDGEEYVQTPFGPIRKNTGKAPSGKLPQVADSTGRVTMGPTVNELQAPLRFEPRAVKLKADGKSAGKAVLRNTFPGMLKLNLRWVDMDGLTAEISHQELNAGETAEVRVEFEPPGLALPPRLHAVWVETSPMRSATPLMIEFVLDEDQAQDPKN